MKERAVSFGGGGLFGVVTEPDRADRDAPRDPPGVIVLNSGLLHKVGPYRLSVNLTRAIGARGHYALRFDLSGIGDSRMTLSDPSAWDRAVADVGAAMDFMAEEYGVRAFVLMGLCSGSDNAHYTSLRDERVVGTVHLDGYAVRDWRYYLKYYGGRLLSLRVLRARFEKAQSEDVGRNRTPAAGARTRVFPAKSQLAHDFKQVTDRGVRLLCIFTRGAEAYNYKGQMRRTFSAVRFGDLLEEEFFPLATHTYSTLESRRKVVARITDWLSRHWGGAVPHNSVRHEGSIEERLERLDGFGSQWRDRRLQSRFQESAPSVPRSPCRPASQHAPPQGPARGGAHCRTVVLQAASRHSYR